MPKCLLLHLSPIAGLRLRSLGASCSSSLSETTQGVILTSTAPRAVAGWSEGVSVHSSTRVPCCSLFVFSQKATLSGLVIWALDAISSKVTCVLTKLMCITFGIAAMRLGSCGCWYCSTGLIFKPSLHNYYNSDINPKAKLATTQSGNVAVTCHAGAALDVAYIQQALWL